MQRNMIVIGLLFSTTVYAGAYKCTDENGKTTYQSTPCQQEKRTVEIDLKTGTLITHDVEERKQELEQQRQQRQLQLQKQKQHLIEETQKQSRINQELIKNDPAHFSAYAIPPYTLENQPDIARYFQWRLPEIERYRRLAAQKALALGNCGRVEASELNIKSTPHRLVFLVDCSSGKQVYLNESQLNPN